MQISDLLALAESVAREAGNYAHKIHKGELRIETKSNEMDLVTQVDQRNEHKIREEVLKHYPDHGFLGEELGATAISKIADKPSVVWIIDPIDGTVNYAHGLPVWCVSVGVEVNGVVECGAIYNPNLNEMFTVHRGHGAFLNGKPIHVSQQENPKQSLFVTGFPYNVHENPGKVIEQFVSFLSRGYLVRRLGSAALDLAYVACGRFEGFWEAYLSPWDTAAGHLMVLEAGGSVTHYDNSAYEVRRKSIIASNGIHHPLIRQIIQEVSEPQP